MIAVTKLRQAQQTNRSHICLGLDLDPKRMPAANSGSLKGMFDFAHEIIKATSDRVCAYKPNLAFYESLGPDGLALLQLIVERIPENIPVIIDGKRNDIGNTAAQYAHALFECYRADWVTINPYLGQDSLKPFLDYKDKGVFVLCLTSNAGSKDFQCLDVNGRPLYEIVAERVSSWNSNNNCGLVVGATHPDQLQEIRAIAGDMPILIPGVGAQGGSLEKAITAGTDGFNKLGLVNVSRSVLYASNAADFAERARQEVIKLNEIVTRVRNQASQPEKSEIPPEPAVDTQPTVAVVADVVAPTEPDQTPPLAPAAESQPPAQTQTDQTPPPAPAAESQPPAPTQTDRTPPPALPVENQPPAPTQTDRTPPPAPAAESQPPAQTQTDRTPPPALPVENQPPAQTQTDQAPPPAPAAESQPPAPTQTDQTPPPAPAAESQPPAQTPTDQTPPPAPAAESQPPAPTQTDQTPPAASTTPQESASDESDENRPPT